MKATGRGLVSSKGCCWSFKPWDLRSGASRVWEVGLDSMDAVDEREMRRSG